MQGPFKLHSLKWEMGIFICYLSHGITAGKIITNTGSDHQRFPAEPVTQTSNDGTGDELEEGEKGAEKSPEQDVVKVSRSSNKTSEQVNLGR